MATTSIPHRWTYDVFLSFRGEDIRKSFMDHLFKDFKQKGIHAFRDDNQLPRGEEISSQLYKAIENSRFLIVVFSKNYASSSWCLKELVKILECKQMGKHKHNVRIIFYGIKPAVVRNQTGSYAEAFAKHEFSNGIEVAKWKEALSMAANLSGWDLEDMANGYESKLIDNISNEILEKLCDGTLHVGEKLVGVDSRVNEMNLLRFVGSSKVHMIGICGIGGIGKTTLAKAIYNLMYLHFEECIFCDDVKGTTNEHGLTQVLVQLIDDIMKTRAITISNVGQGIKAMKQMVASKRILLVLDDIDHSTQLEALAGSHNWFFPGSLIIFTCKDKHLLRSHKVDEIYDMRFLDDHEALELFCLHAFSKKHPAKDFKELAYQVVHYVQGHPLALEVLGRLFYDKTMPVCKSNLEKLQMYPNAEIQQVLRLSFDGLDFIQQRVFLDIACYFIRKQKDFATSILDGCNSFADASIDVLVDKSLLTISKGNSLHMHELIQRMAWAIVQEVSTCLGRRSRLWIPSEVCDVLNKNEVTEAIEVLILSRVEASQNVHIDVETFARMKKLRILEICHLGLENYSGILEFLSNELRLLHWPGFPLKFLPLDFYPENIVSIDMSYSHIKNLWTTPKGFKKLKVMNLSHCRNLTNTPDFTKITNLEELILKGCVKLVEVHPSIGMLERLVVLNMEDCTSLRSFPCKVKMDSLKVLILSGCLKVDKLPEVLGTCNTLVELHVDRTALKEFPSFVFSLSSLQVLSISELGRIHYRWWTSILRPSWLLGRLHYRASSALPSFAGLRFLRTLDASNCNISEVSSESIGSLSCLEFLDLSANNFTSLPGSLSQLSQLRKLILVGCKKLEVLPELPPRIGELWAIDCTSLRELQKQSVLYNISYRYLDFINCPKLVENLTIESLVLMLLPQGWNGFSDELNLMFQGSRIPRWFTKQSTGNYVTVELPVGWCYKKFRGYATCVILKQKNPSGRKVGGFVLQCNMRSSNGVKLNNFVRGVVNPFATNGADVVCLSHWSPDLSWKKAKDFVTFSILVPDEDCFEITKCGVRLLWDEDIQEERGLSMIQDLPPPIQIQDDALVLPDHERVVELIEDVPPSKKKRII